MHIVTSPGDITDMDCSPAEVEDFIKEVRFLLRVIHWNKLTHLSPLFFSALSSVFLMNCTFYAINLFFVTFHFTTLSYLVQNLLRSLCTPIDLQPHDYKMYSWAFLTRIQYFQCLFFFFLQEEGCSIQASPEYWSQGSINGKTLPLLSLLQHCAY